MLENMDLEENFNGPPFYREQREEFENKHTASYAIKSQGAKRLYEDHYEPCKYRTEFQRDRDRIVHSKSFRRLMYKTQVYMVLEGDSFRNRLSHSLELCQIARSIATYLGLNVDLVEAIALAHDLGHTPFGHAVEQTLKDILVKSIDEIPVNASGFDHNCQSLLVVDLLDKKKFEETDSGLNLTNYVRYGILNHTKLSKCVDLYNAEPDFLISNKFRSIEAELVKVVDTLTYLCHDLEDAIGMDIFYDMKINNRELFDKFWEILQKIIEKIGYILKIKKEDFPEIDKDLSNLSINLILKALIEDLIAGTTENIKKNNIDNVDKVKAFQGDIVKFDLFENDFKLMKKSLYKFVYSSPIAQQMDSKANYIVRKLYKSFIDNPKQLPHKTLTLFEKVQKDGYQGKANRIDKGYILTPERVICNYIAGMTDRYALENFKTMFSAEY